MHSWQHRKSTRNGPAYAREEFMEKELCKVGLFQNQAPA
jgi:hypothetical protein